MYCLLKLSDLYMPKINFLGSLLGLSVLCQGCLPNAVGEETAPPIEPSELYRLVSSNPDLLSEDAAASVAAAINASPLARGYVNMRLHGPSVKPHHAVQIDESGLQTLKEAGHSRAAIRQAMNRKHDQVGAHHYCMRTVAKPEVLDCISETTQAVRTLIEAAYIHPSLCLQVFDSGDPAHIEPFFEDRTIGEVIQSCSRDRSAAHSALLTSGHLNQVVIKGIDRRVETWDARDALPTPPQETIDQWEALATDLARIDSKAQSWYNNTNIKRDQQFQQFSNVSFDQSRVDTCMEPVPDIQYSDDAWQPGNDHEPARQRIQALSNQLNTCPYLTYETVNTVIIEQSDCEKKLKSDVQYARLGRSSAYRGITPLDIQNSCATVLEASGEEDPDLVSLVHTVFEQQTGRTAAEFKAQRRLLKAERRRAWDRLEVAMVQESGCMRTCRQIEMDDCCVRATGSVSCNDVYMEEYTHSTGNIAYREVSGINGRVLRRCGKFADDQCQFCDEDRCGMLITEVAPDGPAAASGLPEDAVLTQIDGTTSHSVFLVRNTLDAHKPGDSIVLTTSQGDFTVTLGATDTDPDAPRLGVSWEQQWCPR